MQVQEPMPFVSWRINMNARLASKKDMAGMAKMVWERKKTNVESSGPHT